MIELTSEQVAALADIDAKGFVERVRQDLISEEPGLVATAFLWTRLWRAFNVARGIGIREDGHLVEFLRLEAYSPGFYEKPAMRAWIKRSATSGNSADRRFHDFLCVLRWRIEHPEFVGGLTYGDDIGAVVGERRRRTWAERWKGFVGWCGNGGSG